MTLPDKTESSNLKVIGLGSSAGGLEALRELVSTLPPDLNITYVIAQHMSPHHKSLMTELLARETKLAVEDAAEGTVPKPGHIYITPPNTDIEYRDGKLRLLPLNTKLAVPKPSVDRLFRSLAEELGENSMGVVLSGTGSDGAYGVRMIREAGGITMAQDLSSAKYDGMPYAAIQTGCIDLVLRPSVMSKHLERILASDRDFESLRTTELDLSPLSDLMHVLLARTRVDFREYKQSTIRRRIERRMLALGIQDIAKYTNFCRTQPEAVDELFRDLLISVTRFFRDPAEFDYIKMLLPSLLEAVQGRPFRVWIAGCATGEEAYSIAMLLAEALGDQGTRLSDHVQIFATDIDENALQVARRGVYQKVAISDIPPAIAEKYVDEEAEGIRINDNIRSAVLFSMHNVCQDPPFQRIDLICCRNLMIYFGTQLQRKVLARFQYSLTDSGLLFLGTAESISDSDDMFVQETTAAHVYRRRSLRKQDAAHLHKITKHSEVRRLPSHIKNEQGEGGSNEAIMLDALIQSFGENSVLVREDYSFIRVYGNISPYLEMTEKSNLRMSLDLIRRPLRDEARSLVTLALKSGHFRRGVRQRAQRTDQEDIRLDVYPIKADKLNERAAVVVFQEEPADENKDRLRVEIENLGDEAVGRIHSLENEISNTREALQQTIEELETSNEELQSLNEELQSTNEELQATNEELETSNEELQSTNEELITVNEELQVTTAELSGRTSELASILSSTPMPIMVMDSALQISQATDAALKIFGLSHPFSTTHISQCQLPDGFPALAPICSDTLRLGETRNVEFTSRNNRIQLLTSPFFDDRGVIQGVTVIVSEFPKIATEIELLMNNSSKLIKHRDLDGTILRISKMAAQELGMSREEAEGVNLFEILPKDEAEQLRKTDKELIEGDSDHITETIEIPGEGGKASRWLNVNRLLLETADTSERTIMTISDDITAETHARFQAEEALAQIQLLQEVGEIGYWKVDLQSGELEWSDEVYNIHGVSRKSYKPTIETAIDFYHPDDRAKVEKELNKVISDGGTFHFQLRLVPKKGGEILVDAYGLARKGTDGQVRNVIGSFRRATSTSVKS